MTLPSAFQTPLHRALLVLSLAVAPVGCATMGEEQAATPEVAETVEPTEEGATLAQGAEPGEATELAAAVPASLAPDAAPEAEGPPDPTALAVEALLAERAKALAPEQREGLTQELLRAERVDGLPALLLLSLIHQESRFDPKARGPRGALGLMQIRPFVAADVSYRNKLGFRRTPDLFDPLLNVRIGIAYLRELQAEFADLELALAAYHIGPTRVRYRAQRGWRPKGPYVRTVMSRYEAFQLR